MVKPWRSDVELRQAATVARWYFIDRKPKSEIGDLLGISRFKVARIIDHAYDAGLIHIEIHDPFAVDPLLSERLAHTLNVPRALVLQSSVEPRRSVGGLAARYLSDVAGRGSTIGIAWSRSTPYLVRNLVRLPACTIVQVCGCVPRTVGEQHSPALIHQAATATGGRAIAFDAPLVVHRKQTRAVRTRPDVVAAMDAARNLDVAVIAVGQWSPGESTIHDAAAAADRIAFSARGAVAETAGLLVDADGQVLSEGLQPRSIAISESQLRAAGDVVVLACDERRVAAVRALARSGLINTLITHHDLAARLLGEDLQPATAG